MYDVTVIGLGQMGGALARAFLKSGKAIAVWNRNRDRAADLERLGAVWANSPAEAIAASKTTILCLSDYAAASSVLDAEKVSESLRGRLVVQLSSGTPKQARQLEQWTLGQGANFLDGAISAWPSQIGGPDASIVIAGQSPAFHSAAPLLQLLAANLTYLGADVGHANVLFNSALAYFTGHWIGFTQGAAICAEEGLDTAEFGEMIASLSTTFAGDLRHMGSVIKEGRFDDPESTIKSVSRDIARLVDIADDLKIHNGFPIFAANLFRTAANSGYAAEEHCAIVKVLRAPAVLEESATGDRTR